MIAKDTTQRKHGGFPPPLTLFLLEAPAILHSKQTKKTPKIQNQLT